jgi:hephaestin
LAQPPGPGPTKNYIPRNREYFIAAVEVEWNYAPSGKDEVWGGLYGDFNRFSAKLTYKKAVYRAFTDATFTHEVVRGPEDSTLGILGPVIRGVVGDNITIHFMNKASFNMSIAAHGIAADKANDGALFVDNTEGEDKLDDDITPGQNFTYVWHVLPGTGPFGDDPSSIVYPYHSIVHEQNDINSGLFGATVVTRADWADPVTGKPVDVDKEFVVLFHIFDESLSFFAQQNGISASSDESIRLKYSLNGYIFGNLRGLNITVNETARWYILGAGSDFHSPDWHGNTLIFDNSNVKSSKVSKDVTIQRVLQSN